MKKTALLWVFIAWIGGLGAKAQESAYVSDQEFLDVVSEMMEAAQQAPPGPAAAGVEVDALGRPVSPQAKEAYQRVAASLKKRKLRPQESEFLLALLNLPPLEYKPFRDREALAVHFANAGVQLGESRDGTLAGTHLGRLIKSVRAASQAFEIPPAILLCLTFRESSFQRQAAAWTTSAKGAGQLTNAAVEDIVNKINAPCPKNLQGPCLKEATHKYVELLRQMSPGRDISIPGKIVGAPEVDALTWEIVRLRKEQPPNKKLIEDKKAERAQAIASQQDKAGHIFNLETNFGLATAYLAWQRYYRLDKIQDQTKAWLTTVGAYNQGLGFALELARNVYGGWEAYNTAPIGEIFSKEKLSRLSFPAASHEARTEEMWGEVDSVRRCAVPTGTAP